MSNLSQSGALSPIDRARLSAELLQIRASLMGTSISPIERVRASARGLVIRAQLGQPAKPGAEEGQAAFEKARQFYQENLKGQLIQSVVGPVSVNSTGWKKSKQGMKSDLLKARLIEYVREILETGTAGQRQEPHKDRNDGFVAFYFIQKQVQVDELLVTAGVTVAEDGKGNLFYSISHADRGAWKAFKNGAPDYAGVGPRSGDAAEGMLDGLQQVQEPGADKDTVADGDINITILAVVVVGSTAAPAPALKGPQAVVTGVLPQKSGGVLVMGDPEALDAYAKAYLDQAKYKVAPTGLLLTKSQSRLAQFLPATMETLHSGAVIYTYSEIGGVAVAMGRELSGIARDLPELKSLMAQQWGPEKFRAVFGEDAAPKDVEGYQDAQASIAKRKQDQTGQAAQTEADQVLAQHQEQVRIEAEAKETALILEQQEAAKRAIFEKTIGIGKAENPIYQAYLDTLEELPAYEAGNAGFLGWAGMRAGEFDRQGGGQISQNHDAYLNYVRAWADRHLSNRAKSNGGGLLEITKDTSDSTIEQASDDQLNRKLLSVANDFFRGLDHGTKDIARRLQKGTYERSEAIKALKRNRDYLIERARAGSESDMDIMSRMGRLYGAKSLVELQSIYDEMGTDIRNSQSMREMSGGSRRTGAAVANEGARQIGQHRLEMGIYIKSRQEQELGKDYTEKLAETGDTPADEYAAKVAGFNSFKLYALSRIDKLPLETFQVARAKYKIIEYLEQHGRGERIVLGSLSLQGANGTGPSALAQLRQDGYVLNNLRAQSKPFSLAPGVTLAAFLAGSAKPVPFTEPEPTGTPVTGASETPVPATHDIIEYTTKRDKVLRGIIRTDLTLAEAKAIDPYTWRMQGGYFIREKYLSGDTSAVQAAPVPVVLSPEQEAEKQDRDRRVALERQQQAIGAQVAKLREAGDKAIASGTGGMNADRKTNTSRRAGMAASAYARAAADEAEGQTLKNIADAIEVGAAGPLTNLTSRAQLQELKKALMQGKFEAERGLTYSEQLERRGQPVGEEALRHVSMPSRLVWSSRYNSAAMTLAKKAPTGNSKLIAALKKLGGRTERWPLVNDGDIAITRKAYQVLGKVKESWDLKDPMEMLARVERLKRMGITNDTQLQDACRALLPHMAAKKEESAVVKLERAIIGQKVGIDFFPTPAAEAQRMARLARITKGMRVLEPSAGNGNLADAAAAAGGEVDVIEISSQLRDILTAKGYTVVAHDFNSFTPEEPYQAILMNPPFSNRQDAEHIMRAYGMLASGGTLVAIAGEGVFFGQDQKAAKFRAWLDTHNAEVEKLGAGTFQDNALLAQTSVNARMVVLHK